MWTTRYISQQMPQSRLLVTGQTLEKVGTEYLFQNPILICRWASESLLAPARAVRASESIMLIGDALTESPWAMVICSKQQMHRANAAAIALTSNFSLNSTCERPTGGQYEGIHNAVRICRPSKPIRLRDHAGPRLVNQKSLVSEAQA